MSILLLQDEIYTVFFCNNTWYLFYRLHELLCARLHKMHQFTVKIAEEESKCKKERKESTAVALRLKTPSKKFHSVVRCRKYLLKWFNFILWHACKLICQFHTSIIQYYDIRYTYMLTRLSFECILVKSIFYENFCFS